MSLKTVLYNEFYLLYIAFSIKVGNDISVIRFIQESLYISSAKHFNKQLKRQIDNQEQFPNDDVLNRFIMTQASATMAESLNRSTALHRFIVTQAAATLMKSWNRSAALHCLIITQLATTMAKTLNRSSRLHQLD
ncbi:hypothetical protein [Limosilactobacillus allomucosae]|uniref:Uncharacterized protein n=1 Tax=Limosilactobacillus allomucosae TaxID=3142938 RepID=A0AAU7C3X5_9LACO